MYYTALVGETTEHSVSDVLYDLLIKAANLTVSYKHLKIDVERAHLPVAVGALKELKFAGISVTLPHKLAVMPLLDEIADDAKELGAVNSVKIGPRTIGYNTDWEGIATPVKLVSKGTLEAATIFGSGGAARAAIYACKQLGISSINVVYREDGKGVILENLRSQSRRLGVVLFTYREVARLVKESDLIINATSAGMKGMDATPFDLHQLDNVNVQGKIFFEVVFNPVETPLYLRFKEQDALTIDGLWMMIYQGIRALSIWLDQDINVSREQLEVIHSKLIEELEHV